MIANVADLGPIGLFLAFSLVVGLLAIMNAPRRK
jgi:hypothetical protein